MWFRLFSIESVICHALDISTITRLNSAANSYIFLVHANSYRIFLRVIFLLAFQIVDLHDQSIHLFFIQ